MKYEWEAYGNASFREIRLGEDEANWNVFPRRKDRGNTLVLAERDLISVIISWNYSTHWACRAEIGKGQGTIIFLTLLMSC
jgi:hypothetical protein